MNKDLDYYYRILGLRAGASQADIKKAYRSLVKLYHPDRDQSYDAEVMYREIRKAYKELIESPFPNDVSAAPVRNRDYLQQATNTANHSSGKMRQSDANSRGSSKQATLTSKDWENWEKEHLYKEFSRKIQKGKLSKLQYSNVVFAFGLACLSVVFSLP